MANENMQTHKQAAPDKPREAEHTPTKGKGKWDIIDEHAWESFPASDAPATWAGRDIGPDERQNAAEADATKQQQKKQTRKD